MSFNSIPPTSVPSYIYNDINKEDTVARNISGRETPLLSHPENYSYFMRRFENSDSGSDFGSDSGSDSDNDISHETPDYALNSTFKDEDKHQHVKSHDTSPKSEPKCELNDTSRLDATRSPLDLDKDNVYTVPKAKLNGVAQNSDEDENRHLKLHDASPRAETSHELNATRSPLDSDKDDVYADLVATFHSNLQLRNTEDQHYVNTYNALSTIIEEDD